MNKLDSENSSCLTVFVCICFCAMSIFIALMSLINLTEETQEFCVIKYIASSLLFLVVFIAICSRNRYGWRYFGVFLFASAFFLKSSFALSVNTAPESDFFLLYNAAEKLAQGVNVMTSERYFLYWPYQSAFVAWMALFIKLFGANVVFFKLTNCLFSALTTLLVYKIARRFSSERGARTAGVIFLLYPGTFALASVLTNQHLSEFLLLYSIYVYTSPAKNSKMKIAQSAAAGLLLALSNAIRPVGIIVVLAVLAYAVIRIFSWIIRKRDKLRPLLLRTSIFLALYFTFSFALSTTVKMSGLNDYGLTNNVPEWKFIVGLNEKTNGNYNVEDDLAVFSSNADHNPVTEDLLRERLSITPLRFLSLVYKKSSVMWGSFEPTYWAFTENVYLETTVSGGRSSLYDIITKVNKFTGGYYFWANLLIAVGAFITLRKKQIYEPYTLLMLVALAYFGAHFFIEVQTRYRSLMTVVTFPLIALGVDGLLLSAKDAGPAFGRLLKKKNMRPPN